MPHVHCRDRVLFGAVPAFGHVLPMLPLARAAAAAGADVAVLTHESFAPVVDPLQLRAAGPSIQEMLDERKRRRPHGSAHVLDADSYRAFFGAVGFDLGYAQRLQAATDFAPTLIVADRDDLVTPIVAGRLGVPWIRFHFSPDWPPEVTEAMRATAAQRARAAGVDIADPIVAIDCWPEWLQPDGRAVDGRLAIRPEPHSVPDAPWLRLPTSDRSRVLLSVGTIANDDAVVGETVGSILRAGADVVVTDRRGEPWPGLHDDPRVIQLPFTPLASLLDVVDAAVIAGGAGTLLGCLACGRPAVVSPLVNDQWALAALAQRTGATLTIEDPAAIGPAVQRLLREPHFLTSVRRVATEIDAMPAPDAVWADVREAAA